MTNIQTLELVDRRWAALLSGEKTDTIRWNVRAMKMHDVPNEPDKMDFLKRMQAHYPMITLDTEILFIEHLSVEETKARYADLISRI